MRTIQKYLKELIRPAPAVAGFRFYGHSYVMSLHTNYPTRAIGHPVDHHAIKVHAFKEQGIVVASVDDPRLDAFERQFLRNAGAKLYGPKVPNAHAASLLRGHLSA
jgi:hypothetical protein